MLIVYNVAHELYSVLSSTRMLYINIYQKKCYVNIRIVSVPFFIEFFLDKHDYFFSTSHDIKRDFFYVHDTCEFNMIFEHTILYVYVYLYVCVFMRVCVHLCAVYVAYELICFIEHNCNSFPDVYLY